MRTEHKCLVCQTSAHYCQSLRPEDAPCPKYDHSGIMAIEFAPSARSTIGIEWEIALVDNVSGDLKNVADRVLTDLTDDQGNPHPTITGELLLNTVELVSGVHTRPADAVADVIEQLSELRNVTDPLLIDLISAGSHPSAQWFEQKISNKPRYHKLIERTQWWGRNMMIWGVHVHVGVESRDKVIPLLNGLLAYYPHLQALSASSPLWAGQATGYASNRALMFQQLPTAGLPYDVANWTEFENYVDDLTKTGIIDTVSEVRWDIRPSPHWGTIEIRACDGVSTAEELGAIAALSQCLMEEMSTAFDEGRNLPRLRSWFVRENKWRSARYGLDATIIIDNEGTEVPLREHLTQTVARLAPVAKRLGSVDELEYIHQILEHGASYERQLRVLRDRQGNLRDVTLALARELRLGINT
jgi:carboxylate-amine ligase